MIHTITIVLNSVNLSTEVNSALHSHSDIIIGRMGIPLHNENTFILTIVVKTASEREINNLLSDLSRIEKVKIAHLTI